MAGTVATANILPMGILENIKSLLKIGPTTQCLECGGPIEPGDDFCSEDHKIEYTVTHNP